jgi:hypothetical protein
MQSSCAIITLMLLSAVGTAAQTPAIALPWVYTSGPVGLTSPESARWNVLNPPLPTPIVGPTCSVQLSFSSGRGEILKRESVTLKAGESRSLVLSANEFPSTGNPTGLYALAVVPVTGPVDQPAPRGTCALVTTLEVIDTALGKTSVLTRGERVQPIGLTPAARTSPE